MKKPNIKAFMVLTLFLASVLAMPAMAMAADDDDDDDDSNDAGMYDSFRGGIGASLGGNGYGGELLGSVFQMLLLDGLTLDKQEMTEGVFVLSAEKEEEYDGDFEFEDEDTYEVHIMDEAYTEVPSSIAGDDNDMIYVEVERDGGFEYNLTVGAAITLLIWDHDKSFITAAQKVIDVMAQVNEEADDGEVSAATQNEAIEVMTWLLIHINEIFTGDELFVLNPITWQELQIRPWSVAEGDDEDMTINKTVWYSADNIMFSGDTDMASGMASELTEINDTANAIGDSYAQWLLRDLDVADLQETIWTQFSFDLAQLWVKNFHIEVDVGEIAAAQSGEGNMAKIFSGLDIEFFLFTHHLGGAFLYNDTNSDDKITVDYEEVEYYNEVSEENETGYMPTQNEITHQLILGSVEEFDFNSPEIDEDGNVNWGLSVKDAEVTPVPVGVDLNNYLDAETEQLKYIEFGCQFITEIADEPNDDGTIDASGRVKLEHNFAPWNGEANGGVGTPNTPDMGTGDKGLDMAIVYISTILHFHIQVDNEAEEVDPDDDEEYMPDEDEDLEEELKVGNYLDPDNDDKLEFVDLAGDPYMISDDTDDDDKPDDDTEYDPTTTIIPIALYSATGEKHSTHEGEEDIETDDYTSDVSAELDWNILLYAVCYPEFDGTGKGIWHDPTFSVYMVFTPESAGFWALILLIAGVGLVGIATILIKRRKDNRF